MISESRAYGKAAYSLRSTLGPVPAQAADRMWILRSATISRVAAP